MKKAQTDLSTESGESIVKSTSRRNFMGAAIGTAAIMTAPKILTARRTDPLFTDETVIGEGDFQYKINHQWAQLPSKFSWQVTHNVAVDKANNVYVIHEGHTDLKSHPSIFVFDQDGKFVRAFGSQFQGGGHGIEVRDEGGEEFLYVCAYQGVKCFVKMTLTGEIVWYKKAPMESGLYAANEDLSTKSNWTRKGFLPTNFAFLDDGGFLLADGYGTYHIHRFDKDVKWVSSFGGDGEGDGTFKVAHGIWVDRREGRQPMIVVTDRHRDNIQYFTMDGKHVETLKGFGLPANFDTTDKLLLVPELGARVSILNEKNEIVARLGDGSKLASEVKDLRTKPKKWADGVFVHPHDACFDREQNILVAEWVATGRVSKLTKV